MKKLFITVLLVVAGLTSHAQEGLTWHTDINKAIEISKKEQKPIFLFFTGSDWCGWCIRLQNEVFRTPEFVTWAKEKVVLVELDFPRNLPQKQELKLQNNLLQQTFQVRGYPSVRFVKPTVKDGTSNFEELGQSGYLAGGPSVWIANADVAIAKYVADSKPAVAAKKVKAKKAVKKSV